jgi:YD repeat-containing protein
VNRSRPLALVAAALAVAMAPGAADARDRQRPRTFPFKPPHALRKTERRDALPSLWSDHRPCSRGCRAPGAVRGWPVRPFHRQHLLRAGLNELRQGNLHVGVDILARDGTSVYAMQPGRVRILAVSGPDARVQVGNFVYWHVRPRLSQGRYVHPHREVLGTVLPGAGHVHISEVLGGQYINPLRPGGRLLHPWRDRIRPVLSRPHFGRRGQVSIKGFDPVSNRRARPVLGLAGLAYRLFDRRGRRVGPLQWAYRGSQHLPNGLRRLVYVHGSHPAYAKCVMRRHRPCRPNWVYRLAGGLAPRLPAGWRRRYRLTAYAWDWAGRRVAIDSPRRSKTHSSQATGSLVPPPL